MKRARNKLNFNCNDVIQEPLFGAGNAGAGNAEAGQLLGRLAGILLNHDCHLTVNCVYLFTVDLYPITCKADTSTENLTDRTIYAHTP